MVRTSSPDGIPDGAPNDPGVVNGTGNLIIGYNEPQTSLPGGSVSVKTGSHNLVVGFEHNYSSYGGLVAGAINSISGIGASVTSGVFNTASGGLSSVSGGNGHTASGDSNWAAGGLFEVN